MSASAGTAQEQVVGVPQPPADAEAEKKALQEKANAEELKRLEELHRISRLGLPPPARVFLATAIGGGYGMLSGFRASYKLASLQYLAENAHRLPRTKGAWYFYHKRKNYVVLKQAMGDATKRSIKFGSIGLFYFGIEGYLDDVRGKIDFINTVISGSIVGLGYGLSNRLSWQSAFRGTRTFATFGLVTGLLQDAMRFARGNDVWYLRPLRKQEA